MFNSNNDIETSQPVRVALQLNFGRRKLAEIECARSLVRLSQWDPITVTGEAVGRDAGSR